VPTVQGAARRAFRAGRDLTYSKVLPRVIDTRFAVDGREYDYLWHPHDATWRSERAVEIPIALAAVGAADPSRTLEVGNVLRKYMPVAEHTVIDKYERAPDVVNADALTFSGGPYDLIVSVSTLEHVGYDEEPRDAGKAARAIANLRGLLSPGGELLATIPVGYNRDLDDALRNGTLEARVAYLGRAGALRWKEVGAGETQAIHGWPWGGANAVYGWPWPGANVLALARWRSRGRASTGVDDAYPDSHRHDGEPG
jgi:SAM-dependent methyltransferase